MHNGLRSSGKTSTPPPATANFVTMAASTIVVSITTTKPSELAAEASLKALQHNELFEADIVTELDAASTVYPAEDYHQDYYLRNPIHYKYYR